MFFDDPAKIDRRLDSRSISFENPTGGRGEGGMAAGGRKGAPSRFIQPGETITLADIAGPGRIRHIWMTYYQGPPEIMRAVLLEAFYDDATEPSIATPCLDFFGLPLGRTAAYVSALTAAQEGRGFNSYVPMPFRKRVRLQLTNHGPRPIFFFYQIDYTLGDEVPETGFLHVSFRRENPTMLGKDFVIAEGLLGPGRFLGSVIGIRVIDDALYWYGEGEFKFYRDGDREYPTICGTGLEDYVGTAWGMGPHTTLFQGAPIHVARHSTPGEMRPMPDFVGFYRWHLVDPIVFKTEMRATIQQIGGIVIPKGREHLVEAFSRSHKIVGDGWTIGGAAEDLGVHAFAIAERVDDYCAAAFVYCATPQPVPRVDPEFATRDIGYTAYEAEAIASAQAARQGSS